MTTQTINMDSKTDLVDAYEALREVVVCSGASATAPVHGRRLRTEGLLSRGQRYSASGAQASVLNLGRGGAYQGLQTRSEHPRATLVSLMATMTLHSIDHLETIS